MPTKSIAPVKIKRISIAAWKKGVVSALDDGRTPTDGLRASSNVMLDQDGTVRPRPSQVPYGTAFPQARGSVISTTTNRIANPNFETNTTSWTGFQGTLARITSDFSTGVASLEVTATVANFSSVFINPTGLVLTTIYSASVRVKAPIGTTVALSADPAVNGFAQSGNVTTAAATGSWQTLTLAAGACSNTANNLVVYFTGGTIGQKLLVDDVILVSGSNIPTYFDGTTTNTGDTDYSWTGTTNASTSTKVVYVYTTALLGEIYEFVKQVTGLTNNNYMLGAFNVSGTAKLYYSKDGGAWTVANGKTYDATAKLHYCQVDNKVLAMNGVDNLSYLDVPTLTVIPFTALSSPVVSSVVATGLTGSTFTYYYRVTANSTFGETAASASNSVAVGTQRDIWLAASQYVTVSWGAVTSAVGYNVYLGTTAGQEVLIASGVNGLSFKDDGTQAFVPNVSQLAPVADTTAGAKVTRAKDINGQVFLTGDADNPHYVRYGGTGDSVLDFSPFNGGGWTELGRGAKDFPLVVESFRDGKGTSQITVLCRSTNGHGKRYLLTPNTTTYGTTVIAYLQTTEDNGQDGTNSPDGVILYNDSLWYPSLDGFKTTGTKPQLQNLLSTDTVSETIQTDVRTLNTSYMDACVGLAYQQRLYWALPVGSTTNNQIWTLDLQRDGAWMKPWGISADWMMLYNDNSGVSHFIIVSGNAMFELTDSQATYDNGAAFSTNITSGLIKFSDDGMEWAKVIDVTFWLLRPQGTINFSIAGKTEDTDSLQGLGSSSFVTSSSVAGWGESGWGGSPDAFLPMTPDIFGWSNFTEVPVSFGDARKPIVIEIDEELQWLTYEVNTNIGGTFYQVDDIVVQLVNIGVKDLTT